MEKVKETITWKIRRLDRVRSTLTMIVVEGQASPYHSHGLMEKTFRQ